MALTSADIQQIAQARYGRPVWFVSKAGSDSTGDGLSPGTAYLTIAKAVSVLANGDAIVVLPSPTAYAENVDLSAKTGVLLTGSRGATITRSTAGTAITLGTRCELRGLSVVHTGTVVQASTNPFTYFAVSATGATGVKVVGCRIVSTDIGITLSGCPQSVIEGNEVYGPEYGITLAQSSCRIVGNHVDSEGWTVCSALGISVTFQDENEDGSNFIDGNVVRVRRADVNGGGGSTSNVPVGVSVYGPGTVTLGNNVLDVILEAGGSSTVYPSGVQAAGGAKVAKLGGSIHVYDAGAFGKDIDLPDTTPPYSTLRVGPAVNYDAGKVNEFIAGSLSSVVTTVGALGTQAKVDVTTIVNARPTVKVISRAS